MTGGSHGSPHLGVTEVARRLGVTQQAVRDWIHGGQLEAEKPGRAWIIDQASFDRFALDRPPSPSRTTSAGIGHDRLAELAAAVDRLVARESASDELLAAVQRERDHFRAEAAAAKEAALRVNSAAREIDKAVRGLLGVLELQSDALTQLLAPSSPQDLIG